VPLLDASEMGTGSDYGAFVQYLGIPSLDVRFEQFPNPYEGVYHSNDRRASTSHAEPSTASPSAPFC
jgi:hypothetical protein